MSISDTAGCLARGRVAGGRMFSYCFWTCVAYLETCLQIWAHWVRTEVYDLNAVQRRLIKMVGGWSSWHAGKCFVRSVSQRGASEISLPLKTPWWLLTEKTGLDSVEIERKNKRQWAQNSHYLLWKYFFKTRVVSHWNRFTRDNRELPLLGIFNI